MAHPGGRPTKLTPALVKKAQEFLDERITDRMLLPTIEGLALEIGISRETIYAWEEAGKGDGATALQVKFSDIVGNLRAAQAEKLVQKGLSGQYNSTIAKLILSGKHGYVERSDITSGEEKMDTVVIYRPEKLPDDYQDGRAQA